MTTKSNPGLLSRDVTKHTTNGFWLCEHTDTYCGQGNYCWVHRESLVAFDEEPRIVTARRIKAALGLTNVAGRSYWNGDSYEFRPYKSATVAFARWSDHQ